MAKENQTIQLSTQPGYKSLLPGLRKFLNNKFKDRTGWVDYYYYEHHVNYHSLGTKESLEQYQEMERDPSAHVITGLVKWLFKNNGLRRGEFFYDKPNNALVVIGFYHDYEKHQVELVVPPVETPFNELNLEINFPTKTYLNVRQQGQAVRHGVNFGARVDKLKPSHEFAEKINKVWKGHMKKIPGRIHMDWSTKTHTVKPGQDFVFNETVTLRVIKKMQINIEL